MRWTIAAAANRGLARAATPVCRRHASSAVARLPARVSSTSRSWLGGSATTPWTRRGVATNTAERRTSRHDPAGSIAAADLPFEGHAKTNDEREAWTAWPLRSLPAHLMLAAGVTSFWRGAWYVLDAGVFPDSTLLSGGATLCLGWGGFAALHYGIVPAVMSRPGTDDYSRPLRTFAVYLTGLSVVCCWRGVWVLWDALFEASSGAPDGLASGLTSHIAGAVVLVLGGHFTAMLAPPARIAMLPDIKHLVQRGDVANILRRGRACGSGPAKNDPHAL